MNSIVVYSKDSCTTCVLATSLLESKGLKYDKIDISQDETLAMKIMQATQQRVAPQIFINKSPIGGFDSLEMTQHIR